MFLIGISRGIGKARNELTFAAMLRQDAQFKNGVWCWRQICPGHTTVAEAKTAITPLEGNIVIDEPDHLRIEYSQGYNIIIYNDGKSEPVDAILIDISELDPRTVTLGDLVAEFGVPQLIQREVAQGRSTWQRSICFAPFLCADIIGNQPRIDTGLPVIEIDFLSPRTSPYDSRYQPWGQSWRGFVSLDE